METEKYLDSLLLACAEHATFDPRDFYAAFVDAGASDQDSYQQRRNITNALGFFESKRLVSGEMKVRFTPNLRIPTEVRHGALTRLGRIVVRAPRAIRLGFFFVLLQWKKLVSVLGVLAFFNLARNAYVGLSLFAGWIEYASVIFLAWIVYLLIRRALN